LPFLQLMLPMRKGPIALNSWMHPFSESVGCSGLLLHFLMLLLYAYNVALATSSAETTLVTVTNLRHFQSHIWNSVWRLDQHMHTHTQHQCWKEGCRFGSDWLQRERDCMEKLGIYLISLPSVFDPDLCACFVFGEQASITSVVL
jgi:hypothetical protein